MNFEQPPVPKQENKEQSRREILEGRARDYIKSQREQGVTFDKSDDELVKALVDFSEELSRESQERDPKLGARMSRSF